MYTVIGIGNKKARYFAGLDFLAVLGLGVYGSGGLASIARIRSLARSRASLSGSRSSLDSSASCSDFVNRFGMEGV